MEQDLPGVQGIGLPFWTVISVHDHEGGGGDFAYTVGLAECGLPELHLWARPADGLDPGDDWAFSPTDEQRLLNEFAELLLTGKLSPGDVLHRMFDGGLVEAAFTVGDPVDARSVDAFRAAGALVVPLRWTLHRAPVGPRSPLTPDTQQEQRERLARLLGRLDDPPVDVSGEPRLHARGVPGVRRPTPAASFDPHQPYGPLTALVRVQAIAVACASATTLVTFIARHLDAEGIIGVRHVEALARARARPAGRVAAVSAVADLAGRVVAALRGQRGRTRRWRDIVSEADLEAKDTPDLRTGLCGALFDATVGLLATQVVGDVADGDLRRYGYGAWEAALSPTGITPGSRWLAPEAVLDRLRSMVDALDLVELGQLAIAHVVRDDDGYLLLSQLRGLALTQGVGMPVASELFSDGRIGALVASRPIMNERLSEWLTCVAALMCQRAGFDGRRVALFCRPTRSLLPQLDDLLNEPMAVRSG